MKQRWVVTTALCLLGSSLACGSEGDGGSPKTACVPGRSVACVGPSACEGAQRCNDDGTGYEDCICGANPISMAGGGNQDDPLGGAGRSSSAGSSDTGNSSANPGTDGGSLSSCSPRDMSDYDYPGYRSARHLGGACTETEVSSYYADCYVGGDCSAFEPDGRSADCGACLTPSALDDEEYGPLIQLGSGSNALDETNMAGCIELLGEPGCAPNIMVAALCEYEACAAGCPLTDAASYQDIVDCMMSARTSVCRETQTAATCISDSSHVSACSGSGFESQFLAVGRVFCVETH